MRSSWMLVIGLAGCGGAYCGDALQVGYDQAAFTPYCSGDALIIEQSSGGYGLPLSLQMRSVDGSTGANGVFRLTVGAEPTQDGFGGLVLSDQGDGSWSSNTFFPLQEQTAEEVGALDGVDVQFAVVVTDGAGTSLETVLDLVAQAP